MAVNAGGDALYTLEEFIRLYDAEDIQIKNYFLKQVIDPGYTDSKKLIVAESAITDKYLAELNANRKTVKFTTTEYYKYRYNPKLLSYDLYGTTELWFLIIRANEIFTASEFDFRIVRLYDTAVLAKMHRIIDIEEPFMSINVDEVDTAINS